MPLYEPLPRTTFAYHKDASGNEYYGEAPKGARVGEAKWSIGAQIYTTTALVAWVFKFPVDSTTGIATDAPKFVWNDVETYSYRELGT